MDFFDSVFSDPSTPSTATTRNPETTPPPPTSSSWAFGTTLFKTLASKSESLIDNYYKDLQALGSGLKKETSVIRQAASRAVQDLPARLESGAAIAQESLEAVGEAIENVGSTVSEIIGKDLNFASDKNFLNSRFGVSDGNEGIDDNRHRDLNYLVGNSKPYSRIESAIRALQCDVRTYCDEVEENAYEEWKLGFQIEEKSEEIDRSVEENVVIKEIYNEIVPLKVDEETFWCRYFYRVHKVVKAEDARARIVRKAILGEEEDELSWDLDDDDENGEFKSKDELKNDVEEKGKGVGNLQVGNRVNNEDGVRLSGLKSDDVDEENLGEKFKFSEIEESDGKIGSDVSIISSQRSSHAEDDLRWDEIEDVENGDEGNENNGIYLRKRLSSA